MPIETSAAPITHGSAAPCGAFDFVLPADLEASAPPEARGLARDGVRLMVSRVAGAAVDHVRFHDIAAWLRDGDVLVINTSATLNAALDTRTRGGIPLELHMSTRIAPDEWVVELRTPGHKQTEPYFDATVGERLVLPAGGEAILNAPYSRGPRPRLWRATLHLAQPLPRYLAQHGFPIRYGYVRESWPIEYYQTVFTTETGSAEMPSAGRAFTPDLITRLVARGVDIVPVLLHTGVASLEEGEDPYTEYYRVTAASARRITDARADRRRIIAVGTTVVRAIETVTDAEGRTLAGDGWTDIVIRPGSPVRGVDGLLTGLHEPRASHLLMLTAIAGCDHIRMAYDEALRERYLWHEFGDLHLILRD